MKKAKRVQALLLSVMMLIPVLSVQELLPFRFGAYVSADGEDASFESIDDAALYVRQQLLEHKSIIPYTVILAPEDFTSYGDVFDKVLDKALEHENSPESSNLGDALRNEMGSEFAYTYGGSYYVDAEGNTVKYEVDISIGTEDKPLRYFSTKEEYDSVEVQVDAVLAALGLTGDEAEDFRKIYTWVCTNVEYDYEHKEDAGYLAKQSAYNAINGCAVCQGYASLLYRMCLRAGIDCRVIGGTAGRVNAGGTSQESHAWNLVRINGLYYYADSTWDEAWDNDYGNYEYFLRCWDDFETVGTADSYSFHALSADIQPTWDIYSDDINYPKAASSCTMSGINSVDILIGLQEGSVGDVAVYGHDTKATVGITKTWAAQCDEGCYVSDIMVFRYNEASRTDEGYMLDMSDMISPSVINMVRNDDGSISYTVPDYSLVFYVLLEGSPSYELNVYTVADGSVSLCESGTYPALSVQTITAPEIEGLTFAYWKRTEGDAGSIICYNPTIKHCVTYDTSLYAYYVDDDTVIAENVAEIVGVYKKSDLGKKYIRVEAQHSILYGTVEEHGFIWSTDPDIGSSLDLDNATGSLPLTTPYNYSLDYLELDVGDETGTTVYVRSYVKLSTGKVLLSDTREVTYDSITDVYKG